MEHTTYFAYVAKNMLQITLSRQLNHLGTYFFFITKVFHFLLDVSLNFNISLACHYILFKFSASICNDNSSLYITLLWNPYFRLWIIPFWIFFTGSRVPSKASRWSVASSFYLQILIVDILNVALIALHV